MAAFITMASQMPGRTLDAIRWATASAVAAGFYDTHGFAPPDHIPQHLRRQLIPDENRLIAVGRALFATLTDDPALSVVELPDGLGVCLVHTARGGGKLYVAPDETALFVGSSVDFESGLEAFRDGSRTPLEKFDIDPGQTDA
ncbi:hypothetical protein [Streptomyces sp. CNS654]|uniref:hypothetical protein n=1 Tax=Streptomyces sp. CNS654 TaxID=1506995 RepID=UPI00131A2F5C|nr:hypothetical protein [Streptomyces sp. CNS654]